MSEARNPRVIVDDPSNAKSVEYAGILGDAWELFERKSKDYTNSGGQVFEDSGLMGQFMKMRDKISKLKKPLWDAEILRQANEMVGAKTGTEDAISDLNLEFEDAEEIMMDLVGHCLLAISVLRRREFQFPERGNDPTPILEEVDQEGDTLCGAMKVSMEGIRRHCILPMNHPQRLCEDEKGYQWKREL